MHRVKKRYVMRGPNSLHVLTVLATAGTLDRWSDGRYFLTDKGIPRRVSRNVATWCAAHGYIEGRQGTDFGVLHFTITTRGKQWLRTRLEMIYQR